MEKANLLAKQESDREMAAFSCKNSVNLEVNQKEPEEVDKQHTLFNENILKVLLVFCSCRLIFLIISVFNLSVLILFKIGS